MNMSPRLPGLVVATLAAACFGAEAEEIEHRGAYSRNGQIGYVWNSGGDSGWNGPFDSIDEAMDHADVNIFGN